MPRPKSFPDGIAAVPEGDNYDDAAARTRIWSAMKFAGKDPSQMAGKEVPAFAALVETVGSSDLNDSVSLLRDLFVALLDIEIYKAKAT